MATLTKADNKKSYAGWFSKLHSQSRAASDARSESERQREFSKAMRVETDTKTKYDQLDTNNRLNDRIGTVQQWRKVLEDQLSRLKERIVQLSDAKMITENYLPKLADAIMVNTESLVNMDHRRSEEYILDPIDKELKEEQTLLEELRSDLQSHILEALETLVEMQKAYNAFSGKINDKTETIKIDIDQYNLNERSGFVSLKPFADREEKDPISIDASDDQNRATLERARELIVKAGHVIHRLHLAVHQAANRMEAKSDRVADALRQRIHDTERALRELEAQYAQTEAERQRLDDEIHRLEQARRAKQASYKLAETRLEARHDRPNLENNEDAVTFGLREELKTLKNSMDALDAQIEKSRDTLSRLDDTLAELCQERFQKQQTLRIYNEIFNIRRRLENPTTTRFPPCEMIPRGIVREATIF